MPDAHLPFVYRLGRKRWEAVELYDAWLRGAVLEDLKERYGAVRIMDPKRGF